MVRYISDYTTPDAVNRQLVKANPGVTPSPAQSEYNDYFALITEYCQECSEYISQQVETAFVPYKDTLEWYFRDMRWQDNFWRWKLNMRADLLVVNTIIWNDVELSATQYRTLPTNEFPYNAIWFDPTTVNLMINTFDFNAKVEVSGTWGYHVNPTQMYTTVDASVTLATDSVTSITVAASSAYELLQYVRCESELMQVTARSSSTALTVTRGLNGTTAAVHTAQPLQKYNVVPDVKLMATRMVAWAYQYRNDAAVRIQIQDGSLELNQLPDVVKSTIDRYQQRASYPRSV
jgi:hypothetical protein